ncbi:unnamed protein product [Cochlearia groenlandica]
MSRSLAATHKFDDLHRLLSFVAVNPCPCSSAQPDVFTFNILINGYRKSSRFDMAFDLSTEMKEKGYFRKLLARFCSRSEEYGSITRLLQCIRRAM